MLVDLKFSNRLSAKQCCLLAYWATKCQGTGFCEELAMAPETTPGVEGTPDEQTGRWNRHFNRVVKHTQHLQDCYYLDVPYFARSEAERSVRPIPVLHPVAARSREVQATPGLRSLLDRLVSQHELPQSYFHHKVVLDSAPAPVFPLGLYIDGVSFNRRGESTLGITRMNMLTGVRHLIAAIRKTTLCKCGCRGWCTLWHIWYVIDMGLQAFASGTWPTRRHDSSAFGEGDEVWAEFAGKPCMKACMMFMTGVSFLTLDSLAHQVWWLHALSAPAYPSLGSDWTLIRTGSFRGQQSPWQPTRAPVIIVRSRSMWRPPCCKTRFGLGCITTHGKLAPMVVP